MPPAAAATTPSADADVAPGDAQSKVKLISIPGSVALAIRVPFWSNLAKMLRANEQGSPKPTAYTNGKPASMAVVAAVSDSVPRYAKMFALRANIRLPAA